jgi:cytochrome c oxidase assembly protein subunit 15
MRAFENQPRQVLDHGRTIRLWLYAVAALVFAMVLIGGTTRLTESGLSITEWQPVTGVLPPLNEAQWQVEFEKYQTIPQYQQHNAGMSLLDFKTIYLWEWAHRLVGRLIGIAFVLPLLWFLWQGSIPPGRRAGLWAIFALGALQGAIGWWMVGSGLVDRVEVSQYRLATHLLLAALIYAAIIWTASRWEDDRARASLAPYRSTPSIWISGGAAVLLALILVQIYLGALVAGLRAGYAYNTWPLIDGSLLPQSSRLFFDVPLRRNFFENPLTVQFDHRMLGYAIWFLALLHFFSVARMEKRGSALTGAALIAAAVTVQAALGIWTLLSVVALPLALMHQAMAMVTLTLAVIHLARLMPRQVASERLEADMLASHK